jgi:tetratricopeptide (TPR) repeat protein
MASFAERARTTVWTASALVLLAALSGRTIARNPDWRSNLTLAVHDVAVTPRSAKLHGGAGIALADAGETDRAERHFRRAVEIWPDYAQMHYNLGQLLAARGARDEAIAHLREAARISPGNPGPYKSLAPLLERAGRTDEALAAYAAGSRLDPRDFSFRFNRGRALLAAGRVGEARDVLARLAGDDPDGLIGALAEGLAREVSGDAAGAAELYRALLDGGRLPPDIRRRVEARLLGLRAGSRPDGGQR